MSKHKFLICRVQARELSIADRAMQPFTTMDEAHTYVRIINEIQPQFNQHYGRRTNQMV